MIVVRHQRGHLAVPQQSHAEMCAELARAWGNERFERSEAAGEVEAAAAGHELGMLEWDREPSLDPASGLPASVKRMDLAVHLPLRRKSADRLAEDSAYAALLCSLHHTSFYRPPSRPARLRRRHRLVHAYLADEAERQRRLRAELRPVAEELEGDWRLVRALDGISHALLHERAPTTVAGVPRRRDALTEIQVLPADAELILDPWPFTPEAIEVGAAGRPVSRCADRPQMLEQLAAAPWIELRYKLRKR